MVSFPTKIARAPSFVIAIATACIALPTAAQTSYDLAVTTMLRFSDETLDEETNTRVARCYVDAMTPEQQQIMANAPSDDTAFEVLMALPMAATDCENAVVSEATGVEWRRP